MSPCITCLCTPLWADLERVDELGQPYPANGKGTPPVSGTTCGRGAGMADMAALERETNVEVVRCGQIEADGTVRWCAAETVVGRCGLSVVMPRS